MNTVSILLVGVGGQGIVLAGNILANACIASGFDVKKSEVHGMAQRGGSVVSHVRFGESVLSPVIPLKGADYIVSFERMEFLRYLDFIKDAGTALILNSRRIYPPSCAMGEKEYPNEEIDTFKTSFKDYKEIDADSLALLAGSAKALSTIMLKALSEYLPFPKEAWFKAIDLNVPEKAKELNLRIFKA